MQIGIKALPAGDHVFGYAAFLFEAENKAGESGLSGRAEKLLHDCGNNGADPHSNLVKIYRLGE